MDQSGLLKMKLLLVVAVFIAGCATSAPVPPAPSNPLYDNYSGVWQGEATIAQADGAQLKKASPGSGLIKLDVRGEYSTLSLQSPQDLWWRPTGLRQYQFSGGKDLVFGTFLHAQASADPAWREHQDLVVVRVDDKTLYLYWTRVVTNPKMKVAAPYSKFATLWVAKLSKVEP